MLSIEDLLGNEVNDVAVLLKEITIYIGDNNYQVRFKFFEHAASNYISFTQSHHIHTPTQAGKYTTSSPFGDSLDEAMIRAKKTIVTYYASATREGHTPSEDWFIPNEDY